MTGPAIQQRDSRGYVQMPGGYDAAVQQAGQQQAQPQTQLGQPVQQAGQGPQFAPESMSPLAQQAPRLPWDRPAPAPQPQQQPAPFQQQPAPTPQQAAQQMQFPVGADLNARVSGANIPPELQGRTIGEIIGIANGLRQVHLQSLQQPGQMQQQPIQQPAQQQQGQPAPFDWKNPQESIARVVGGELDKFRQQLAPVFAPLIQQNARQGIEAARNAVAAEIPNYAQIEPLVLQRLQGIDQASLSNPETWRIAARVAIGDLALQGGRQQQFQQQQQQPGVYPLQQVGPGQNPAPNLNSFFSEQPMQGGQQNAPVQLTSQELAAAAAMNMNPSDYFAWKGGTPNGQGQMQPGGFRR